VDRPASLGTRLSLSRQRIVAKFNAFTKPMSIRRRALCVRASSTTQRSGLSRKTASAEGHALRSSFSLATRSWFVDVLMRCAVLDVHFRNHLSVLFLSSREGRSRDCAHDRSPPSIKL
jgi:hypothetical protein